MTRAEAAEILRLHNLWRRDRSEENPYAMQPPKAIGEAIDMAVAALLESGR